MADIVLTTLNAKYIHAAFGLRYLLANLGSLRPRAVIVEFDLQQRSVDVAEVLLSHEPKIIGLGVYIWNVALLTEIVATLKRVRPEVTIILGGPEVSYATEAQPIVRLADHVITGEADLKFAEICRNLLEDCPPGDPSHQYPRIIPAEPPEFSQLVLPYDLYVRDDIAHRMIYVEASRGCPFECEFCLSSLSIPVRAVDLSVFLGEMQKLLDRGVRQFKFVDRTFNLNIRTTCAILEFFCQRHRPGQFYHFEMIPDRLPVQLRKIIAKFPPGALQFEVGIQTFNSEVARRIQRRQNYESLEDNLQFLRNETGVHIHADLIFGLPGESVASFAAGFDRLVALRPQEIQVGILKRLAGTSITRHDADWKMVYNPHPPYELFQNDLVDFLTTQRMRRFARYWDLVGNSGNFVDTTPLLWNKLAPWTPGKMPLACQIALAGPDQIRNRDNSPFHAFMDWSDWLHARLGRSHGIALVRLMQLLFEYFTNQLKLDPARTAEVMFHDYQRGGHHDIPAFLKPLLPAERSGPVRRSGALVAGKRQTRHLAVDSRV